MTAHSGPSLGYAVILSARAVEAATMAAAATVGMSKAEMNLLYEIAAHTPVSTSMLARLLNVGPSAITPLTNALRDGGLIESEGTDHDKRVRSWGLTARGAQRLQEAAAVVGPEVEAVFGGLTTREAAQLERLLGKVAGPWLTSRRD